MNQIPSILNLKEIKDNRGNLVVFENYDIPGFFMNKGSLLTLCTRDNHLILDIIVDTLIICLNGKLKIKLKNIDYIINEPNTAIFVPKNFDNAFLESDLYCNILIIKNSI